MDTVYNWGYYCSETYERADIWEPFFANFAKVIVEELNPKTVLDVGCAVGYLVAALRDLGVEAYGVDISNAAIEHAKEEIKPYLQVNSLTEETPLGEGFPQQFDLVTNIEVLEHIYEEDIEKAIGKLCSFSDKIIFSSSPSDITEETHVNVRQPEYWAKLFSKQKFYRAFNYDLRKIAPDIVYYIKNEETEMPRIVEDYEHFYRLQKNIMTENYGKIVPSEYISAFIFYDEEDLNPQQIHQQNSGKNVRYSVQIPDDAKKLQFVPCVANLAAVKNLQIKVAGFPREVCFNNGKQVPDIFYLPLNGGVFAALDIPQGVQFPCELEVSGEVILLDDEIFKVATQQVFLDTQEKEMGLASELESIEKICEQQVADLAYLKEQAKLLQSSFSWRVTTPLRFIMRNLKKVLRAVFLNVPGLKNIYTYLAACHGLGRAQVKFNKQHFADYGRPNSHFIPPWEELAAQEREMFSSPTLFSIVVPLYNTLEEHLRAMIQSVLGQTYPHWELCLVDGSDESHQYVKKIVKKYARKDKRIRYKKLENNKGISENTNAAIDMAQGEFIALLDHDDVLNINALYEMQKAICEKNADFAYSDEVTFEDNDLAKLTVQHFKPDFAIDNLRANNYICHFTVFKKALLEKAGGALRSEFDGSQDYDLVLRLTEQAEKIIHVPKALYFWRSHSQSVASSAGAKPYAVTAAVAAINGHLERVGLKGKAEIAPGLESMYKINYELTAEPLISILIPNKDEKATLEKCINSICEKTTYKNYEIIICENNSTSQGIFSYYETLEKKENVKVIKWDKEFNYSLINNFCAQNAKGEYFVLLNNDTEIISENWLEEMLMYAQRKDVGIVGAKLYYPDETLQHGGVVIGMLGLGAHAQKELPRSSPGYMGNLKYARNVSAVTAACMMVRRDVFEIVNGLDKRYAVAFNDIDFCMRVRKAGYLIVFTPFAELYHYESKSRGEDKFGEKRKRFENEVKLFQHEWKKELEAGDPYFNPNFNLEITGYEVVQKCDKILNIKDNNNAKKNTEKLGQT